MDPVMKVETESSLMTKAEPDMSVDNSPVPELKEEPDNLLRNDADLQVTTETVMENDMQVKNESVPEFNTEPITSTKTDTQPVSVIEPDAPEDIGSDPQMVADVGVSAKTETETELVPMKKIEAGVLVDIDPDPQKSIKIDPVVMQPDLLPLSHGDTVVKGEPDKALESGEEVNALTGRKRKRGENEQENGDGEEEGEEEENDDDDVEVQLDVDDDGDADGDADDTKAGGDGNTEEDDNGVEEADSAVKSNGRAQSSVGKDALKLRKRGDPMNYSALVDALTKHLSAGKSLNDPSGHKAKKILETKAAEFGLRIVERKHEKETANPLWFACRFCAVFGVEGYGDGRRGRSRGYGTIGMQMFSLPFLEDLVRRHMEVCHEGMWSVFCQLDAEGREELFDRKIAKEEVFQRQLKIQKTRQKKAVKAARLNVRKAKMSEEQLKVFEEKMAPKKERKKEKARKWKEKLAEKKLEKRQKKLA